MIRRHARQIYYVCSAIKNENQLISVAISAKSPEEATSVFLQEHKIDLQTILGPFYKKKTQVIETTTALKFASNKFKKAIYNDWEVNAFILSEPVNHAYLIFIKRIDNKKMPIPKGTITAPISDLRFINE